MTRLAVISPSGKAPLLPGKASDQVLGDRRVIEPDPSCCRPSPDDRVLADLGRLGGGLGHGRAPHFDDCHREPAPGLNIDALGGRPGAHCSSLRAGFGRHAEASACGRVRAIP